MECHAKQLMIKSISLHTCAKLNVEFFQKKLFSIELQRKMTDPPEKLISVVLYKKNWVSGKNQANLQSLGGVFEKYSH